MLFHQINFIALNEFTNHSTYFLFTPTLPCLLADSDCVILLARLIVLVAVNPLRTLPGPSVGDFVDVASGEMDPHPFGMAELAFQQVGVDAWWGHQLVGEGGARIHSFTLALTRPHTSDWHVPLILIQRQSLILPQIFVTVLRHPSSVVWFSVIICLSILNFDRCCCCCCCCCC